MLWHTWLSSTLRRALAEAGLVLVVSDRGNWQRAHCGELAGSLHRTHIYYHRLKTTCGWREMGRCVLATSVVRSHAAAWTMCALLPEQRHRVSIFTRN